MSPRPCSPGLVIGLVFIAAVSLPAWAYSPYLDEVTRRYQKPFTCEVCHDGAKLNRFGEDFRFMLGLEGGNALKTLEFIELLDSDGDGWSNGDELRAGTYPGNKASFPHESPAPAPKPPSR